MPIRDAPARVPRPPLVSGPNATPPRWHVRVPTPVFFVWIVASVIGAMFGIQFAVAAVVSWQPGKQGDRGLQSLLDRLTAGEIADEAWLFTPDTLASVDGSRFHDDGARELESFIVGTPATRERFGASTTFSVTGESRSTWSTRSWNAGTYDVTAVTTFTLGEVAHEFRMVLEIRVQRSNDVRDNAWLIDSVIPKTWSTSVVPPPLREFTGTTMTDVVDACPPNTRTITTSFRYNTDRVHDCVMPGTELPEPFADLLASEDRMSAADSFEASNDTTSNPYVLIGADVTGPFLESRVDVDGAVYRVVIVPVADGSGRIVAVSPW